MKRIVMGLNGCGHINVECDHVTIQDGAIIAMRGEELAAYADLSVVLTAHVSQKEKREEDI